MQNYSLKEENEIRSFWEKEKIPDKFRGLNKSSKKTFFMMDGPPYATGHLHMGTTLNKVMKDIAIRYKTMTGHDVFARAGYDTHGLPIEFKVQEELHLKYKEDIEKFGVSKFIEKCIEFATEHIGDMNKSFENLGVWMDFEDPYLTLNPSYIEALWQAFKTASEKKLLYKGKYPVHFCPQCGTAISYNEIEHANLEDTSIFIKFKTKEKDTRYLCIWTTTPWTLPSNIGVMVHPNAIYCDVQVGAEVWIVAKELLEKFFGDLEAGFTILKEYPGKKLEGLEYTNPISSLLKLPKLEKSFRVVLSDRYVTMEEGTGLVHCAPGHGKEDYDVGVATGLPVYTCLNEQGVFGPEAGKYAGKRARETNKEIIEDFRNAGNLLLEKRVNHEYPICWRCHSPVLMLAMPQWFLKVTAIRDDLLKTNKTVKWVESWAKARFEDWLSNLGDWPISRARYWGTPLPIWECKKCGDYDVFGTFEELEKALKKKIDRTVFGVHKPEIDKYSYSCKCGARKERVPDVLDVWFDAGASSWGVLNYPEYTDLFEKYWPGDFNVEGSDQFRGWWNSQIILSQIVFGKTPFKSVFVHGMVLDINKREMHKSAGNVLTPEEVIAEYNRDLLRFGLIGLSDGNNFAFGSAILKEKMKFFNIVTNIATYAETYLDENIDCESKGLPANLSKEDKWILSKYNSVKKEVLEYYEGYLYDKVVSTMETFLLEDLSRKYMKLIKSREDKKELSFVFGYVFGGSLKLLAPIIPHFTEYIYKNFNFSSIHLKQITPVDEKLINKDLENEMSLVLDLTQLGLSLREQQKLRLRWTLPKMYIYIKDKTKKISVLKDTLCSLLNVDAVEFSDKAKTKLPFIESELAEISVDKEFSKEVQENWFVQELRRSIQEERKIWKFNPLDVKNLNIFVEDKSALVLKSKIKELEKETNTKINLLSCKRIVSDSKKEPIDVLGHKIWLEFI